MRMPLSYYYELSDLTARQITNGVWFITSLFLLSTLLGYLLPKIVKDPRVWNHSLEVKLAWGFTMIVTGNTVRSGWIWVLLMSEGTPRLSGLAAELRSYNLLTFVAIAFCVWGTVCVAKVFVPSWYTVKKTNLYLLTLCAVSLIVPVLVFLLLRVF